MNPDDLIRNASLPDIPVEFSTREQRQAWQPQAALDKLRELNQPGISRNRLQSIQALRAHFNERLIKLN